MSCEFEKIGLQEECSKIEDSPGNFCFLVRRTKQGRVIAVTVDKVDFGVGRYGALLFPRFFRPSWQLTNGNVKI